MHPLDCFLSVLESLENYSKSMKICDLALIQKEISFGTGEEWKIQ
jgi:hypothetical protein